MSQKRRLRTAFALVGAPSCAKGACVKLVFQAFGKKVGIEVAVVSVSQKLEQYINNLENRRLAEQILDDMKSGRLVPDEITNAVFESAVEDVASEYGDTEEPLMIVLDGAPRTANQIQSSIFSVTHRLGVPASEFNVVHISTPPHICAYRMGVRGRKDDKTESVVATRFEEFFGKTLPAIKLLKGFTENSNSRFHEINGQFMQDEAFCYQRQIFHYLCPEYFPGIHHRSPALA